MNIQQNLKKFILSSALLAAAPLATAGTIPPPDIRVCPSVEELKTFDGDLVVEAPVSFEPQSKTMNTALIQKRHMPRFGDLVFVLSGVKVVEGEDPETKAHALMADLKADSETPIVFHNSTNGTRMSAFYFCSYSVPDNDDVKAIVFRTHEPHHHHTPMG